MNRQQHMLLEFLRECETNPGPSGPPTCPVCGYNLLTLTRPICPECGQELVLTVGATRLRLDWLLVALAPGFFSGIAAVFVAVPLVLRLVIGDGQWSPALTAVDLFGWCSGTFSILLAVKRVRFLALSRARQRWFALIIWFIHIAALGMFILLGPRYL